MAFLLQPIMRYLCEKLTGITRLLIADLFILFAFFGTVNVWRGIWNLLNMYFLPGEQISISFLLLEPWNLAFSLNRCLDLYANWMCKCDVAMCGEASPFKYIVVPWIKYYVKHVGSDNRFLKTDLLIIILTENRELSCWITCWISLLLLILMGCSNSLLVRGVYIDAEEPDGKCVVFPCYYLRTIFQEDKLKKLISISTLNFDEKIQNKSDKPIGNNHIPTISMTIKENNMWIIFFIMESDIYVN